MTGTHRRSGSGGGGGGSVGGGAGGSGVVADRRCVGRRPASSRAHVVQRSAAAMRGLACCGVWTFGRACMCALLATGSAQCLQRVSPALVRRRRPHVCPLCRRLARGSARTYRRCLDWPPLTAARVPSSPGRRWAMRSPPPTCCSTLAADSGSGQWQPYLLALPAQLPSKHSRALVWRCSVTGRAQPLPASMLILR